MNTNFIPNPPSRTGLEPWNPAGLADITEENLRNLPEEPFPGTDPKWVWKNERRGPTEVQLEFMRESFLRNPAIGFTKGIYVVKAYERLSGMETRGFVVEGVEEVGA